MTTNDMQRYDPVNPFVFEHHYQQLNHILRLAPKTVLEIGPGEYTATDYLRRRGISVTTFDNAPGADYVGDMRKPPNIPETFDLVFASEVFEHVDFRYLDQILEAFKRNVKEGGKFLISLPYGTIRLFPKSKEFGRFVSCEGRVLTGIPIWVAQPFLTVIRGFKRLLFDGKAPREAFEYYKMPEYPDDDFIQHHWDAGTFPTTRRCIRQVFRKHFTIINEVVYLNTNCIFFLLERGPAPNSDIER